MGDLLTLTFDDDEITRLWRDRSGHGFHAHAGTSTLIPGYFGQAMSAAGSTTFVPDYFEFSTPELTFESWIRVRDSEGNGLLVSDGPNVLELEVGLVAGALALTVNDGGPTQHVQVVCEDLVPVLATWTHVAVTWDGQTARFYEDAELVCELPLQAQRVESPESKMHIGRSLDADLDELKLSSYVKSRAQIAASMNFDSTGWVDRCGDGFVLLAEPVCESSASCCTSSCERHREGSSCQAGSGGTGVCDEAGLCVPAQSGRIGTGDLLALYTFDALDGDSVRDQSGTTPTVDLHVVDTVNVKQHTGFLRITGPTALVAAAGSSELIGAMRAAGQLTVEAWVTPAAEPTEDLPRTLISLSDDEVDRSNLTLGQAGTAYVVRSRLHFDGGPEGAPVSATGLEQAAPSALDHVVFTYGHNVAQLYVNGQLVERAPRPAGLHDWNSTTYTLKLGNEVDQLGNLLGREWLGDLHLVALYDRALDPTEIARNYLAGADP